MTRYRMTMKVESRVQRIGVPLLGALCLLGRGVAAPARVGAQPAAAPAQRDAPRARKVSFEAQVNYLAQQLAEQRRVQEEMARVYAILLSRSDSAGDASERVASQQAARVVLQRYRAASTEQGALRKRLESLCSTAARPEGYLGVTVTGEATGVAPSGEGPVTIIYRAHQKVESVEPGSPAEKAGIRAGDILVAIAGKDLRAGEVAPANLLRPGSVVPLRVLRDGDLQTLRVLIEPRPESFAETPCPWIDANIAVAMAPPRPEYTLGLFRADSSPFDRSVVRIARPARALVPPTPRASSARPPEPPQVYSGPFVTYFASGGGVLAGAQMIPMNQDLGETFGVDRGLLVLNVLPGTPASSSGLKGGDVLLSANDDDLESTRVLQRVINAAAQRGEHEVRLTIIRKKQRQTVSLKW